MRKGIVPKDLKQKQQHSAASAAGVRLYLGIPSTLASFLEIAAKSRKLLITEDIFSSA